jgi:type II secretory pathway predicted ATPase ExeA
MTPMYETYFNLQRRPFNPVPRPERYYPAASIEAARTTLARCIERAEGVGLLVGPAGTGKTLLCQLLAEQLKGRFQVVLLSGGGLRTPRALFQAVLHELGQPYRGLDEGELRLALAEYLTEGETCPHGAVLLVDEAHALPPRLLDEVGALTNLAQEGQPRLRLLLAGSRMLEEHLSRPKLESFNQRVVARCYLEALNRSETQEFIAAEFAAAGGEATQLCPGDACQSVYKATDGVPRLINQVCDHALLLAYAAGQRSLDPGRIEEAWADLQQLPTPWNEKAQPSGDIIEFGGLEDESAPPAAAQDGDESAAEIETPAQAASLHLMQETVPESEETAEVEAADVEAGDVEATEQLRQIQEMLADVEHEFCPAGSIGPEIELVFDDSDHPFQEAFQHEEVIKDRYAAPAVVAAGGAGSSPPAEPAAYPPPAQPYAAEIETISRERDAGATRDQDVTKDAAEEIDGNVEDEQEADAGPAPAIAAVRRRDFGGLFAKLRQG